MKPGVIPYQPDDFVHQSTNTSSVNHLRPQFPELEEIDKTFFQTVDIPLNKRNFIYYPCAPNNEFKQLGYSTTEYPYKGAGWNVMDRSAGVLLKDKDNQIAGVPTTMGWRTTRCDVCIKEGISYWEIEVIKGGTKIVSNENSHVAKKDAIDSSAHLRFGISRREASLESPVGFDAYGYGIRDQNLESIFEGKLKRILNGNTLKEGDVLSFILNLPNRQVQIRQAQEYTMRRINAMRDVVKNKVNDKFENDNISCDDFNATKKRHKTEKNSKDEFRLALLEDIDYNDVIRDNISIRYKSQLFFEATDYVKTTKPEYYSSDSRERQDFYSLDGSYLSVYLNGEFLGNAFENLKPFLPPFSELQYNEKFYYGYWKNGEVIEPQMINDSSANANDNNNNNNNGSSTPVGVNGNNTILDGINDLHDHNNKTKKKTTRKGLIARNKYVNNNKLGYYPTVSCFNGGQAKIIVDKTELKFYEKILNENKEKYGNDVVKTLDVLHMEQVANDTVWDIIDEIEEEFKPVYNLKPTKSITNSNNSNPIKISSPTKVSTMVRPSSPLKNSTTAENSKANDFSSSVEIPQPTQISTSLEQNKEQNDYADQNNQPNPINQVGHLTHQTGENNQFKSNS